MLVLRLLGFVSIYGFMGVLCATAETLRVAVAANFAGPLEYLAPAFERNTGHRLSIISGSSGKLYAQIVKGAPFDVFLSADTVKPQALVERAIATEVFTYARGQLVFLINNDVLSQANTANLSAWLNSGQAKRIAIANPNVAPYGFAAKELLAALTFHASDIARNDLNTTLINAENISQVGHYINSHSVDAGFIAASLLPAMKIEVMAPVGEDMRWVNSSNWWLWFAASDQYPAILQQGVILPRANKKAAIAFRDFLLSQQVQQQLRTRWGYLSLSIKQTPVTEVSQRVLSDDES